MGDLQSREPEPEQSETARLLAGLDVGPPVAEAALARLVAHVSARYEVPLPEDYVAFLRTANGADGTFEGGGPIVLFMAEVLPQVNADNEEEQFMPGCFVIGTDAGDATYGIDLRTDAPRERYVETFDFMDWDYVMWRGDSLLEVLRYASSPQPPRARGLRASLSAAFGRLRR
jgi:SMI1 / KNR4 family (SUKH-1)